MREDDMAVAKQKKHILLLCAVCNMAKFGLNSMGSNGGQVIVRQNPLVNFMSCKLGQPLAILLDFDASIK